MNVTCQPLDCDQRQPHRQRAGFTLMEILLVMAIIVFVGALAIPTVLQTISRQSLDKGADRVRVAMGQARVRSIREGEIYAVFFLEGGAWFNVAPFTQAKLQSSLSTQRQRLADSRTQPDFEDDLLPKGITFAAGVVPIDARAAESLAENTSGNSIRPILFYPDGTSQDAQIVLQNDRGSFAEIQLRGLTGLSIVVRLQEAPNIQ